MLLEIDTPPAPTNPFVRKPADQVVTNSAALVNDNALALAVAALAVYELRLYLVYSASGPADFKLGFTGPADMAGYWTPFGAGTGSGSAVASEIDVSAVALTGPTTPSVAIGGVGLGSKATALVTGILRTTTAGTLTLQWAQSVAQANDATVYADSYMRLVRVA